MSNPMNGSQLPLERPRDDRVIAGVASGLARRLGIGVGWVRVGFVFLSFFGGLGVLLYVIGWLAIREEGETTSVAEHWIGGLEGSTAWIGVGLIILAGMVLLSATDLVRIEFVMAGGLFLAGILLYRGHLGPGDGSISTVADPEMDLPQPDATTTAPLSGGVAPAFVAPPTSPQAPVVVADGRAVTTASPPAPAARPPSFLGRLVVAAGFIVIGAVALFDNLDVSSPGARHYVAAGLLVIGVGLLVGSFFGRARGLIALGLLMIPVLLVTAAVRVPFGGEWGDRSFAPASAAELQAEYELSGGQLHVDLRQLRDLPPGTPLKVELGIGELVVWLPADTDIEVTADVGIGALDVFGAESGGLGVDDDFTLDHGDGETDLVLDLEVGIGALRIVGSS